METHQSGQREHGWKALEQRANHDNSVTGTIQELNKGGALVRVHGVSGFVPFSHMAQKLTEDQIGAEIACHILECDRNRNKLILSNLRWKNTRKRRADGNRENENDTAKGESKDYEDGGATVPTIDEYSKSELLERIQSIEQRKRIVQKHLQECQNELYNAHARLL